MVQKIIDGAENVGLRIKVVVVIVVFAVSLTSAAVLGYANLKADDAALRNDFKVLKVEINSKLTTIIDKIDGGSCKE